MTIPYKNTITYGPIQSRRLGRSLGLNLLPLAEKICSFNCIYCQYGKTKDLTGQFLPPEEIIKVIEEKLTEKPELDHITFSGNGEPMLHPHFFKIVSMVKNLRDELMPSVPIAILTNGTEFREESKCKALELIDKIIAKIDCGNEECFEKVNRPLKKISFAEHIANIKKGRPNYIQTLFIKDSLKGLNDWYRTIEQFGKVCEVQIYSLDRPTETKIAPVSVEELQRIAERKSRVKITAYHRGI